MDGYSTNLVPVRASCRLLTSAPANQPSGSNKTMQRVPAMAAAAAFIRGPGIHVDDAPTPSTVRDRSRVKPLVPRPTRTPGIFASAQGGTSVVGTFLASASASASELALVAQAWAAHAEARGRSSGVGAASASASAEIASVAAKSGLGLKGAERIRVISEASLLRSWHLNVLWRHGQKRRRRRQSRQTRAASLANGDLSQMMGGSV